MKMSERVVCAWCDPRKDTPDVSHGICDRHLQEVLVTVGRAKAFLSNNRGHVNSIEARNVVRELLAKLEQVTEGETK